MTSATPPSIPIMHGRYRIEEKLGTGRLAVVYRAYDDRLQRPVLLHMLRKELLGQEPLRQRFVQEAHASARRSHQSLLEVFDSGEIAGRPYMITEFVSGRTISELGALSLEEALLYFRQVVGAVAACQAAGVPHPPISSNNLILVADGHVELLESWRTTPAQVAIDIASYRAPERTEGQPMTSASAVYSLGLLLFEMLTGRRAITGDDPRSIAQAHLTTPIPPLSEVRHTLHVPSLERLLMRMLARQPDQRPPNALVLGQELDDLRRTITGETQRLAIPPVRPPDIRARLKRTAADLGVPNLRPQPAPQPVPDTIEAGAAPAARPQPPVGSGRNRRSPWQGLAVLLVLFLVVGCVSYQAASYAINQLFNTELPTISVPAPELPDWLASLFGGGRDVLVVSGNDLLIRAAPGLNTEVVGVLSIETRVRRVDDEVQVIDNIAWLRIRGPATVQEDGRNVERTIEGWSSANFLRTPSGQLPDLSQ